MTIIVTRHLLVNVIRENRAAQNAMRNKKEILYLYEKESNRIYEALLGRCSH